MTTMETKTIIVILIALAAAAGGVWWWLKQRKTSSPLATPNGKLMSELINNLDWNSRTCATGRRIMERAEAHARAMTPKPAMGKAAPKVLCSDALGKIDVKKVLVGAVPNINAVTIKAAGKALDALITEVVTRECKDGSITADALGDALKKMTAETCDPDKGTLLPTYSTTKKP